MNVKTSAIKVVEEAGIKVDQKAQTITYAKNQQSTNFVITALLVLIECFGFKITKP